MTPPVTEAQLRALKVGDEIRFSWGWEEILTLIREGAAMSIKCSRYGERTYCVLRNGVYSGSRYPHPLDILEIRPAKKRRSGEIWQVIGCYADGDLWFALFPAKENAVKHAKSHGDQVLAITNKTTWSEGDGLELLEGGE